MESCLTFRSFIHFEFIFVFGVREWEKIFANDVSDKGLVAKIYKELIKLNSKETNNPIMKWAKDMNRNLTEEDLDMANKPMRKCSTSLAIREIQIKTTMRSHLTPGRMVKINKAGNSKCWRECGERGTLLHCWWECELAQPLWKPVWMEVPQRVKNRSSLWPSNCTAGDLPQRYRCSENPGPLLPNVSSSNVHNSQSVEGSLVSIER